MSRPKIAEGEESLTVPPHASKELRALFEQMKVNSDERKRIYAIVESLNSEITEAENKRAKAEKKVHPKYNKLDMLDKAIR